MKTRQTRQGLASEIKFTQLPAPQHPPCLCSADHRGQLSWVIGLRTAFSLRASSQWSESWRLGGASAPQPEESAGPSPHKKTATSRARRTPRPAGRPDWPQQSGRSQGWAELSGLIGPTVASTLSQAGGQPASSSAELRLPPGRRSRP